jgi:hypothetical protein
VVIARRSAPCKKTEVISAAARSTPTCRSAASAGGVNDSDRRRVRLSAGVPAWSFWPRFPTRPGNSARRESFENREPRGIAQEYVQLTHQPADLGQLWEKVQRGRPGASHGASALLKARSKG